MHICELAASASVVEEHAGQSSDAWREHTSELDRYGFESRRQHVLAVWPWAAYPTSLSTELFLQKARMIIARSTVRG